MIEDLLKALALREEDSKTYLALLETGPVSASALAKHMGEPRPSVYGYLERLMSAGLVYQSQKQGVKLFVPESPRKLDALFQRRIQQLQTQQKNLQTMLPELEKRGALNLLRPRMTFVEGRSGLETALEDMLNYPNIETLAFWPAKDIVDATSYDYFRYHNIERVKKNISIKAVWPSSYGFDRGNFHFFGTGELYKRELRIAPEGIDFTMGYWVYGHKVLFMSSRAESYGFIMESRDLAQMMAVQHQLVWNQSIPAPPIPDHEKLFRADLAERE